ncbi:UDP-glucose:glycoprotein glucosyltransferase [Culicoides brevitarsis]|uniref:UDP-glucose:glycoprotein glucosyltransferase n=1 Tax=Culicoides brevitarsis TaxID=469753 RepID=UPI00307B2952
MRKKFLDIIWFVCFIQTFNFVAALNYPVFTHINAKWNFTPVHLEIAEFLADESNVHYWDYVEALNQLKPEILKIESDEKQYDAAIKIAENILPEGQMSLLKLALSLKTYTPLVYAHAQIVNEILRGQPCEEEAFVQIGDSIVCDLQTFDTKIEDVSENLSLELFSFDHIYPSSAENNITAILYGQIGTKSMKNYHNKLKTLSDKKLIKYVIRNYVKHNSKRKIRLSGYGVEMHLKSTEYKSQDDSPKPKDENVKEDNEDTETELEGLNFDTLKQRFSGLSHVLDTFRSHLIEKHKEVIIAPLKAWELQDLGLQASERIASIQGDEALHVLQMIAQNFPLQVKSLLHIPVTEELKNEMKHNIEVFGRNLNLQPPDAALFVNGLFFDAETLDIFTLLDTLRSESRVLDGLFKLGFKGKSSEPLLALDLSSSASKDFAIDIRDSAISWINDLEKDNQYRRWPSSVLDLLRPTFPGMMRNVRKNLFNLIIVFDPLTTECRDLLKLAESFVVHTAPVRLGLVLAATENNIENEVYRSIICAFNYVSQQKSMREALEFLTSIFSSLMPNAEVSMKSIENQMTKTFPKINYDLVKDILGEDSDYDYGRQLTKEFIARLGTNILPQVLLNGVLLPQSSLNINDFEEAVLTEIMQQTPNIQKAVYRGELDDTMVVIDYLMSQSHVMPRLNERILNTEGLKFLDLTGTPYKHLENVKALSELSDSDMTATLMDNLKYFETKSSSENFLSNPNIYFHSLWVVGDLTTKQTKDILKNALKFMKSTESLRVSFIPNADNLKKDNINNLVWSAVNTLNGEEAIKLVLKLLESEDLTTVDIPEDVKGFLRSTEIHLKMLRVYCQRILNLKSSASALVLNGKVMGPLDNKEIFDLDDFGLLEKFNNFIYVDKIRAGLKEIDEVSTIRLTSDVLLKLNALLIPRQSVKTRYVLPNSLREDRTVVKLQHKRENAPSFSIVAVLDPVSRGAQKLSSILILLRKVINCDMKLFLCAIDKHSDMPVKNFYRYVIESELEFREGKLLEGPAAKFIGLPSESLLTQNLNVPENWLVEITRSVYDLDNIRLSDINGPIHSEYELEHLLLEGHCFDSSSGAPPRGLQFVLGTRDQSKYVDTLVMANLGYFQLKANPGAYDLRLRHGKSSDLYDITQVDGANVRHFSNHTRVVIINLRSLVLKVRVTKKPGMHGIDLLSENDEPSKNGIWSSIANTWSGGETESETINIFSVASGHLYERLLRIMMLSLLKNTKSPVKFWFLKNYLSPQFIDFLPHMSKHYKFHYEFVQYKWPRWLHQQTEKQRIIWGYKILFLDVLFPLDVKKIIFVDADQIIRHDINELYNFDLGGAPYGYVPFCDSRKEMEGFRFWKVGYWKNHLQGRPYHISALYVVDLKRFRRIAAGDRLRGQYQALSQDPNSLSNLDQDLPNNMIHQVMIKSLPQDWLWCETWCSSESLATAKTIDLCNNPQTKEAKLTAAQRIVPEWKDYDAEIKNLMTEMEDVTIDAEHSEKRQHDPTEL